MLNFYFGVDGEAPHPHWNSFSFPVVGRGGAGVLSLFENTCTGGHIPSKQALHRGGDARDNYVENISFVSQNTCVEASTKTIKEDPP